MKIRSACAAVAGLFLGTLNPALADPVKVLMQTNRGAITLELYPDKAPATVQNFLAYLDEGFYQGTVFHRVIDGFMIQGGGFTEDLKLKSTHGRIQNEADNGLKNERGTIAMARTSDPHSATSQFFINTVNNPKLDFTSKDARGWGYTVFGKVVEGMPVVDDIAKSPTESRNMMQNVPKETIVIQQASRVAAVAK